MLIKTVSTIGFLLVFVITLFLATKQQERSLKTINPRMAAMMRSKSPWSGGRRNTGIMNYVLGMAVLVLGFVQFWILTRVFPYSVIALLMAASLIGLAIHTFIGALAGFSREQDKIGVLTTIWGAQRPIMGCILIAAGLIMIVVMALGALYKFWALPLYSSDARGWIAFFLFILPQLVGIPLGLLIIGPMLTSQFLDDDIRNSVLSRQFSNIIYSTVTLVFPVWIFNRELGETFRSLPPYWVIVSIPFVLFVIGGVFPFFIGGYRYRAEAQALLEWRTKWLIAMNQLLKLPESENRSHLFDEKLNELKEHIQEQINANELLSFYQALFPAERSNETTPLLPAPEQATTSAATLPQPEPVYSEPTAGTTNPILEQVYSIITDNREKLRDWDVRFRDLHKLIDLYRSLWGSAANNVRDFVEANLNEAEQELTGVQKKRNVISATLLTVFSTVSPWLVRTYQSDIIAFITQHTHLKH